jgi:hypothetical protein
MISDAVQYWEITVETGAKFNSQCFIFFVTYEQAQ